MWSKGREWNINGTSSRNSVRSPLEFLIVAPEGVAITEYQLIRLRLAKDYREFRTVTGGVFNQRSGAMRDMVPFEGKKIAPRMFTVNLPDHLPLARIEKRNGRHIGRPRLPNLIECCRC